MKKLIMLFCAVMAFLCLTFAIVMLQQPKKLTPPLIFGISHEAPYAYINTRGGMEGLFPEALTHITKELHISDYQWQVTKFNRLLDELQNGRISVIASGIAVTAERAVRVCFAEPLFVAQAGLLRVKPVGSQIARAEHDLHYLVLSGSVEETQLQSVVGSSQLTLIERVTEGISLLKAGKADALALSIPTLLSITEKYPDEFIITENPLMRGFVYQSAFALNANLKYLIKDWNRAQRKFLTMQSFAQRTALPGFSIPTLPAEVSESCYAG